MGYWTDVIVSIQNNNLHDDSMTEMIQKFAYFDLPEKIDVSFLRFSVFYFFCRKCRPETITRNIFNFNWGESTGEILIRGEDEECWTAYKIHDPHICRCCHAAAQEAERQTYETKSEINRMQGAHNEQLFTIKNNQAQALADTLMRVQDLWVSKIREITEERDKLRCLLDSPKLEERP